MKVEKSFIIVSVSALLLAFTNKTKVQYNYQYLSETSTRYQVDPTLRSVGFGSGQFTCNQPATNSCAVNTVDITPTQDGIDGLWYINKSDGTYVPGTYTIH